MSDAGWMPRFFLQEIAPVQQLPQPQDGLTMRDGCVVILCCLARLCCGARGEGIR